MDEQTETTIPDTQDLPVVADPVRKINKKRIVTGGLVSLLMLVGLVTAAWGIHDRNTRMNNQASASVDATTRNNVVVFMVDDLDEASFNQLLAANKLPNIKQYLIDKGVRFTNSFVTESICCSSRATFVTGKYSHNTGVYHVVGSEGGMVGLVTKGIAQASGNTLISVDWLPSWLDSVGYYTGHIGKFMNSAQYGSVKKPGFDYWRNIAGYDARPGMYYVYSDTTFAFSPDVFQHKYMSDRSIEFINNAINQSSNFYLQIAPHSPHITVPRWVEEVSTADGLLDSFASDPVAPFIAYWEFDPPGTILLRRGVIKEPSPGVYISYAKDKSTAGWGNWYKAADTSTFNGTGIQPIVAFSASINPDTTFTRQHLIRGTLAAGYTLYYRDLSSSNVWGAWKVSGTVASLMPNTGNLPVKGLGIHSFANNGIVQYLLRGDENSGYELYHRGRVNGVWTNWYKEESMWDVGTGNSPIEGINIRDVGNGLIDLIIVRKSPNSGKYVSYRQRIRNFYATVPSTVLGDTTDNSGVSTYVEEGEMFDSLYAAGENSITQTTATPYPDKFNAMRTYADGAWPNLQPSQTYSRSLYPGGIAPAGSLRQGGSQHGFVPIAGFDLPGLNQPSFNNCAQGSKHPFICNNWVDLNRGVIGPAKEIDYLRRQHLDRQESMLSVDVMVGQVMGHLQQKNLLSKTLVIFISDNGYFLGDHRLGNKMFAYDQSIKVPLIIRSPNSTLTSGFTNTNTVANIDMAPTILDYSGLDWKNSIYNVDGRSLKPILSAPTPLLSPWRKFLLVEYRYPRNYDIASWTAVWGMPDHLSLRIGDEATLDEGKKHLYVHYLDDPLNIKETFYELYDMNSDPSQVANKFNNTTGVVDPAYAGKLTRFESQINALKTCAGTSCRTYDAVLP